MYSKKQWSVFLSLVLISQEDYKWHGYEIKKQIKEVYFEDNENVFPILREMISLGLVEYKEFSDDNNRIRKHYKITKLGLLELKKFEKHNKRVKELLKTSSLDMKGF